MAIENSVIQLYTGVKFSEDETCLFSSRADQNAYFDGTGTEHITPLVTLQNYSYVDPRGDNKIRINMTQVSLTWEQIKTVNYIRYNNMSYENKWYYAFVTQTPYLNDGVAELSFDIDPLQTWLPDVDYQLNECRIVRQHQTGSDNIGDNLQPENVQVNDYSPAVLYRTSDGNQYADELDLFADGYYIAVLFPNTTKANQGVNPNMFFHDIVNHGYYKKFPLVQTIDGTLCGDLIFLFDPEIISNRQGLQTVYSFWGNDIIDSWIIPKSLIDENTYVTTNWQITDGETPATQTITLSGKSIFYGHYTGDSTTPYVSDGEIKAQEIIYPYRTGSMEYLPDLPNLPSYEPYRIKNKKLLTNPYCFYSIASPTGETRHLSFEKMLASHIDQTLTDYTPYVKVIGSILKTKISIIPIDYDECPYAYDKQQGLPSVPIGSIHGLVDTTNESRIISTIIQAGFGVAGTALGGPVGTALAGSVGGAVGMAVNKATEQIGGGGVYNANDAGIWGHGLRKFTGTKQYAINFKEIDAFFEAYGYTQNKFAVPDITHRALWTFVQTDGAHFSPVTIDAQSLKTICDRFNRGIRFHKHDYTIGNLSSYTNAIIQ